MSYSHPSEIVFYRLAREDAKIHRCDCGAWVYAGNPCGACGPANTSVQDGFPQVINGARPQIPQTCTQRPREDSVPIPRLRTEAVHDRVGSDRDMGHAGSMDQRHERRAG